MTTTTLTSTNPPPSNRKKKFPIAALTLNNWRNFQDRADCGSGNDPPFIAPLCGWFSAGRIAARAAGGRARDRDRHHRLAGKLRCGGRVASIRFQQFAQTLQHHPETDRDSDGHVYNHHDRSGRNKSKFLQFDAIKSEKITFWLKILGLFHLGVHSESIFLLHLLIGWTEHLTGRFNASFNLFRKFIYNLLLIIIR